MSADNAIYIDRKACKAYYCQGDMELDNVIAEGHNFIEVFDKVEKWIKDKEEEYKKDGFYFELEYGIRII